MDQRNDNLSANLGSSNCYLIPRFILIQEVFTLPQKMQGKHRHLSHNPHRLKMLDISLYIIAIQAVFRDFHVPDVLPSECLTQHHHLPPYPCAPHPAKAAPCPPAAPQTSLSTSVHTRHNHRNAPGSSADWAQRLWQNSTGLHDHHSSLRTSHLLIPVLPFKKEA